MEGPEGVKTFDLPGYEAAMDLPWSTAADGSVRYYRDHPERGGNVDEAYLAEQLNAHGCAPIGGKHAPSPAGAQPQSVTVLSGATLSGFHFADVFCWEGTCTYKNPLKGLPADVRAITRTDGYMMTWYTWKYVLESLAEQIPGAWRVRGLGRRAGAR